MKKLIEIALPIKEISAESVRDKSLRHGHISTLHLWWARRPLPACRAIVFASLVPDPDDPQCPQAFKDKVRELLGSNPKYKPYRHQEDTLRNRLLAFIAKWSEKKIAFDEGKSDTSPATKEMLDDACLVKWESSINPDILKIARELIQAAYEDTPTVLDPFAGGGAIPLEAVRLGCNVIANDYNPVAHLIQRCTFEFPYKYGKPFEIADEDEIGGKKIIANKLAYDVERHAKNILERVKQRIGHLYPQGKDGHPVVGYLWARTAPCSNPSCKKQMPLLKSMMVCDKKGKQVALTMTIGNDEIRFGIAKGNEITLKQGTMLNRGNVRCPFCSEITPVADLRTAGINGNLGERMVCVITDTKDGKDYRPLEQTDSDAFAMAEELSKTIEKPNELVYSDIVGIPGTCIISPALYYGMPRWGDLFNQRQLVAIQYFVEEMKNEKIGGNIDKKAVLAYSGLFISRVVSRCSNIGVLHTKRETFEHAFGRHAIPMVWDYPETVPISEVGGGAMSQLDWILDFLKHESPTNGYYKQNIQVLLGDASSINYPSQTADIVVTDPPYFDSIAYADLSDFFYVWLKRSLGDVFPEVFSTPLTPKSEEATALKHRHEGSAEKANQHFEKKLTDSLIEAKRLCKENGVITVMFAHQSTHAWTALINAIFNAGLNVTATYPIDTELTTALKATMSALSSSVTVVCRPRVYSKATTYNKVRTEIEKVVKDSIERFWGYGFRGADLIVACYGPAVGVVGQYEYVEKQGEPVAIADLLNDVREIALKTIAGAFSGDVHSRFYFVVANIYGISEQKWDDIRLVAQIGCGQEDAKEFSDHYHYIVREEDKARLAMLADREDHLPSYEKLDADAPLIDQLHIAMRLWKQEKRSDLVRFLKQNQRIDNDLLWKLAQTLFEILPRELKDRKIINALLSEKETLKIETRREGKTPGREQSLFDENM